MVVTRVLLPCRFVGQCTKNHFLSGKKVSSKLLRQRAALRVSLKPPQGGSANPESQLATVRLRW